MPVYFVEEAAFEGGSPPYLAQYSVAANLTVLVPHMPAGMSPADAVPEQQRLLAELLRLRGGAAPVLWFNTSAALRVTGSLRAAATIYDCMDELANFQGAGAELRRLERELLHRADLVFAGGASLYAAKRRERPDAHLFPSAVDAAHFAQARGPCPEPPDQASIPHPRLGFFGVIDERLDRDLIASVARSRPDWQLILIGPVVKISPESLPRRPNIHYLGRRPYDLLPAYAAGWDAAIIPFARNAATHFISPTKTPEYLAAGKPVVSTPIRDVVRGWSRFAAVRIADGPAAFVAQTEAALSLPVRDPRWLEPVDRALRQISWDHTWARMAGLIEDVLARREAAAQARPQIPLPVDPAMHRMPRV